MAPALVACTEPGCSGSYEDGYCNICGSPENAPTFTAAYPGAESAATGGPSTPTPVGSEHAEVTPAPAGPAVGAAPARAVAGGGGQVRASARRRIRTTRRARTSQLGMGLTQVPPVPYVDPASQIMQDAQLPEEKRVCPNCGAPVGRAVEGTDGPAEGRTEGFCPQCRSPYSFTPKLQPGDKVAGQYEVAGALAYGGLGWLYLAQDRNVADRWVVLKGLLNSSDQDALAAAIAEQQFLAQVEHPLIVEIYNTVTHEGQAYIVMEYVGGTSLKQLLKQRIVAAGAYNPFPVEQALAYVLEVLPAFSYLHDIGLLYCDFKPDNLIQVGDGVKLIDLGGVRRADDQESPIYGTVGYQAPEVAELGPSVASDIYTIGRTLAVLTFEFRGYQREFVDSLPPQGAVPVLQRYEAFYRLIAKACAPDPDDRFVSIEEMRGQMIGVLRQVVSTKDKVRPATQTAHSMYFDPPSAANDTLAWWDLPSLKPDDHDPMLDWLGTVREQDPLGRFEALRRAPEQTPEVLLDQARSAMRANRPDLVAQAANTMIEHDPWDWRAVWVIGLDGLARGEWDTARSAFGAVRDQVPGELAPRLALALTQEKSGDLAAAEAEYIACLRTDASYVDVSALGLARLRIARNEPSDAVAALDLIPASSREYARVQRIRADLMRRSGELTDIRAALAGMSSLSLGRRDRTAFEVEAYEAALQKVNQSGERTDVRIGEVPAVEKQLRQALEKSYRRLAGFTGDAEERQTLVDKANRVRPWTLL